MEETRRVAPAVIYFFIAFNLFRLTFGEMLARSGMQNTTFITTIVGAIIVGKVMIVADHLPILNLFSKKPLVYNTLWRTSIYFVFCYLIRLMEHLIPLVVKYNDLGIAIKRLMEQVWWVRFWTIQVWYLILLLIFVFFQDLNKALGSGKIRQMFFGR